MSWPACDLSLHAVVQLMQQPKQQLPPDAVHMVMSIGLNLLMIIRLKRICRF
jgi:hypothetical protein